MFYINVHDLSRSIVPHCFIFHFMHVSVPINETANDAGPPKRKPKKELNNDTAFGSPTIRRFLD